MDIGRVILLRADISGEGGAESYMLLLCRALVESGWQITLLTSNPGKCKLPNGVQLVCIQSCLKRKTSKFPYIARQWCLKNKGKGDCIISLDRNLMQDVLRLGDGIHAAWLQVRKEHKRLSFWEALRHKEVLKNERLALSPQNTGILWANSHYVAQQAMKFYGFPADRINVIYNGVDTSQWQMDYLPDLRKYLGLPQSRWLAVFVGSGWWRKGWDIAVSAVHYLRKEGREISLVGIGKPGKGLEFRRITNSCDWCQWIGMRKPEELRSYFAAADCLFLPTRYDPFANVTLEALASGLPVLTSTNNGASELFPQDASFVKSCEITASASRWAEALDALVGNRNLDQQRQLCRSLAKQYDLQIHIDRVLKMLSKLH